MEIITVPSVLGLLIGLIIGAIIFMAIGHLIVK